MHRSDWFDDSRIERTVTRTLVCSHLLPEEISNLDKPLAFGDGLTDFTYWEWIKTKSQRLFLILADLGVPDQIFGVIDDSWEDDDLPIPLEQVDRLALTAERDPRFERKFYSRQFFYLLRPLDKGQHIDYGEHELVPLDAVEKRPAGLTQDAVHLPGVPGEALCRRRFPLGLGPECMSREQFMYDISSLSDFQNEHTVCYWASYTHRGCAYILFAPAAEYKLGSLLTNPPPCFKSLDKTAKRRLVLDWIHCLADTLCFIHGRGLSLGNIKPSTILFTHDHHVILPDPSPLNPYALASRASSFDKTAYDYAAPEQWVRPTAAQPSPRGRSWSMSTQQHNTPSFSISRGVGVGGGGGNGVVGVGGSGSSGGGSMSISSGSGGGGGGTTIGSVENPTEQRPNPQAADIFSLGCVILELLSHGLLKRSAGAFAAHRAAKHKSAGRGGAVPDSSFHRNLGQVETWMAALAKDAAKKAGDSSEAARMFRGVAPLLRVVEKMLALQPAERPSAVQVQGCIYQVLTEVSGLTEPHCVHHYHHSHQQDTWGKSSSSNKNDYESSRAARSTDTHMAATLEHQQSHQYQYQQQPQFQQQSSPTTFLEPASPSISERDDASEITTATTKAGSASTIASKRSSVLGSLVRLGGGGGGGGGGGHRRNRSDDSSGGTSSHGDGLGLGFGFGGGSMSLQNLRVGSKARLWPSRSFAGSAVSSGS